MNAESLDKALYTIIIALKQTDINEADKMELLINLYHFLDVKHYKSNVETLKQKRRYEDVQTLCNRTTEIDRYKQWTR